MSAVRTAARFSPLLSAGLSVALALGALTSPLQAQTGRGPLREAITRGREQRRDEGLDDGADEMGRVSLPANVRVVRDVAYGTDPKQRFDVYIPAKAAHAPVLFVVHGGGWRRGDKAARSVVENKVAHWTKVGFIVISANYRLLPAADPIMQAGDLALAVAVAQRRLPTWGGDPDRMVLVGHSAGAHLVALLATDGALLGQQAARPVIGTLILDSAALNVELLMLEPHLPLYDAAFGTRRKYWAAASPYRSLAAGDAPFMLVCSTLRRESCNDAAKFARRAKALGVTALVRQEALSHRQINEQLGAEGAYTDSVDAFLGTLDYSLARALRSGRSGRSS